MWIKSHFENLYCKGLMSKQGQIPLLQSDSHASVARLWRRYRKGDYVVDWSNYELGRVADIQKRGTVFTLTSLAPFPHATPEGDTG